MQDTFQLMAFVRDTMKRYARTQPALESPVNLTSMS